MLPLDHFLETADCIFHPYVHPFQVSELLRHIERLREEALDLTGTRDHNLIFLR